MEVSKEERAAIMREVRHKAERRAKTKIGFMWHLAVFLMANGAMIAINMNYSPNTLWFVWPLGGWGAALLMHAFATFQGGGMTQDMIEAEVQRELARRGLS
jgi:hypothetical protein